MSKGFEVYIESGRKALTQLDNYVEIAKTVKKVVAEVWSSAKVYAFGSVVKGKYTAMSDIDMLIVVDGVSREEAHRVKAMIHRSIEAPIELQVIFNDDFNHWYKRFVDKLEDLP